MLLPKKSFMIFELRIRNWEKHNPRSDVKSCSWYRQSNDFFSDPDFYEASPEKRLVWIYVLCVASRTMKNGTLKVHLKMISDATGIKQDLVKKAVQSLIDMGCLENLSIDVISTRSDSIESEKNLSATNERTNERTGSAPAEAVAWIAAFNNALNSRFRETKTSLDPIRACIKAGYTLADAQAVIEFKKSQWLGNEKMNGSLVPTTLFRLSNFEKYVDEAASAEGMAKQAQYEKLAKEFDLE